jgi:hypothetical protein
MLKKSDVLNRPLALLLVSDNDGTAVETGVVREVGGGLEFEHGGEPPSFPLPPDALERIRPVDPENAEVRAILGGADFVLTLTVGDLPEGRSSEEGIPTGLKWPSE